MSEKNIKETIHAKGLDIEIYTTDFQNEYISLTDIAKYKSDEPAAVIQNWMRNRDIIEFLGLWESLHNPAFKPLEFEGFRNQAGSNAFTMSPNKWINATNAVGIISKSGRYGGTYAHSDIAFEFASWISPEFKLYIIRDYQRLKNDENSRLSLGWNLHREISKINYRIHTDAVKLHLLPPELTKEQITYKYASEADMLNVALFGMTAKKWREENPKKKGNIRDYASLQELLVLSNMESYNAILIEQGKGMPERLQLLRKQAVNQMQTLSSLSFDKLPMLDSKEADNNNG
ncbi:MAG: KilA-N domain-containing protein [Ruminococcus sp.]|nr:KilA-N domain-containing protein [Ruminococcus sp.]